MHFPQALLLSATLSSLASALPQRGYENKFCSTVTSLMKKEKCQSAATAYCSSYLKIATPTVYVTKTSTKYGEPTTVYKTGGTKTVPGATVTATETSFTTPVTEVLTTEISTVSEGLTTTTITNTISTPTFPAGFTCTAAAVAQGPVARDILERSQPKPSPKPKAFDSYKDHKAISSACGCLAIPTPYAKVTKTKTATVTARSTSTVHKKVTVTQGTTQTITQTESAPEVTSFTTTISFTTVPSSTVTETVETRVPGTGEISPVFRIRTSSPDLPDADGGLLSNGASFSRSREGDLFRLTDTCQLLNVTSGSVQVAHQFRGENEVPAPVRFTDPSSAVAPISCLVNTKTNELTCLSNTNNMTAPGDFSRGPSANQVCTGQYRAAGTNGLNDPGSNFETNRWRLGNEAVPADRDGDSPWQCSESTFTIERVDEASSGFTKARRVKRGTLGTIKNIPARY